MNRLRELISRGRQLFASDSLFRNAVYLMSSTAIMSVLGFGFWVFVAHLYPSSQIGTASALISITLLISNVSFFGLNAGFVRFLPTSKTRSNDINAALITVGAAAMATGAAYLVWVGDDFAQNLSVFHVTHLGQIIFLFLMAAIALNTLTDSIFIAARRAEFHTLAYTTFGLIKLILPLLLIRYGSLGIFLAYCAAVLASLGLTFIFMRYSSGYRFFSKPNWHFITSTRRYVSRNYIATLLVGLPSQVLPTLIVRQLGASSAAYFAMAFTMANLLNVIPSAITNSLLAESSHDMSRQATNVRHASRILAIILIPSVIVAIIISPYILRLFGQQYATGGTVVFQLLAFTTFAIAGNSVGNTIMNIEQRTGGVVMVQATIAAVTLALAWPLMHISGLPGAGLAVLLGNIAGNIVQVVLLMMAPSQAAKPVTFKLKPTIVRPFLRYYGLTEAKIGADIGGGDRSATVVVTSGARKYVLKIYSTQKRSLAQVDEEIKFTQFLLKRGVPAPHVEPNQDRKLITQLSLDGQTWLGVLMDYELGRHPQAFSPRLLRDMAEVQGRLHLIGIEYAHSGDYRPDHVKDGSLRSSLVGYVPKGVSHFDYYPGNVLAKDNHISCVIDFEGMRYDPLVVCVFFTLTQLHDRLHDPAQLQDYLRSYQAVRPLNWLEKTIIRAGLFMRFPSVKIAKLQF